MKCTVKIASLSRAVKLAALVAPRTASRPVLELVRLRVDAQGLLLHATDLQSHVQIRMDTETSTGPASVSVNACRLAAAVAALEGEEATLSFSAASMRISCDRRRFTLRLRDGDDAHEYPEITCRFSITAAENDLHRLIAQTLFACAPAGKQMAALGGIRLEAEYDRITAVSTDGRRMAITGCNCQLSWSVPARRKKSTPSKTSEPLSSIIPARAAELCLSILRSGISETATLSWSDTDLHLHAAGVELASRLLEGAFPKWRQMREGAARLPLFADLKRKELLEAVLAAAIVTQRDTRAVAICRQAHHEVCVRAADPITGESEIWLTESASEPTKDVCPCPPAGAKEQSTDLQDRAISESDCTALAPRFDPRYLAEYLRAMSSDRVALHVGDCRKATMWLGDQGHAYLLMPITIESDPCAAESDQCDGAAVGLGDEGAPGASIHGT